MEQIPTGRATNWALGGTLNCEPQRQRAPCPGDRRRRSPADVPGEEPEVARRARDHWPWRGAAAAANTDSFRARSPTSRGSSWLQPAQSRHLILPHGLRSSVPGGAEREVPRSLSRPGWSAAAGQRASRLRHASLRPPRGSKCSRTPRCCGKGTDSAHALRSPSRPPPFPTAWSASRQTPGTNTAAKVFSPGISMTGQEGRAGKRSGFAPLWGFAANKAAFVALTACTFQLHFTKAPRVLKNHQKCLINERQAANENKQKKKSNLSRTIDRQNASTREAIIGI